MEGGGGQEGGKRVEGREGGWGRLGDREEGRAGPEHSVWLKQAAAFSPLTLPVLPPATDAPPTVLLHLISSLYARPEHPFWLLHTAVFECASFFCSTPPFSPLCHSSPLSSLQSFSTSLAVCMPDLSILSGCCTPLCRQALKVGVEPACVW